MCSHGSFLFLTVLRDVNFILQFVPVWGLQASCRILIRGENITAAIILNIFLEETPIITLTSFSQSQSQAQSLTDSYVPHLYLLSNNINSPSDVSSPSFLCYCALCFSLCSLFKVWRIFLEFMFIYHVTFLISSSSSLNLYWSFIKPNKSFFSSILMNVHLRISFSPPFTLHHHVSLLVPPCLLCI